MQKSESRINLFFSIGFRYINISGTFGDAIPSLFVEKICDSDNL